MRTIKREIVSALIFSKEAKLLMGRKDPEGGGVYPDCWHIPGGGVDEGETMLEALAREIKEEVGIDIERYPVKLVSDSGYGKTEKTLKDTGETVIADMHFNVFRIDIDMNAADISIQLSDDLVEVKWLTKAELKNIKQMEAGEKLFKELKLI